MKNKKVWHIFPLLFLSSLNGWAYGVKTHNILTDAAFEISKLSSDGTLLVDLGLVESVDDPDPKFPKEEIDIFRQSVYYDPITIKELVLFGSEYEDEMYLVRPLNHFFDPQNNRRLTPLPRDFIAFRTPNWALEDTGELSGQDYSYNDAIEYMDKALTSSTVEERDKNWGKLFKTLGQVVHLLQDMAQPQHTRNDKHPPMLDLSKTYYEAYTDKKLSVAVKKSKMAFPLNYPMPDPAVFNTARRYFYGDGKGLSEFSSNNFVSAGTNFVGTGIGLTHHDDFPLPRVETTNVLAPTPISSIPCDPDYGACSVLDGGEMTFLQTQGYDGNAYTSFTNDKASTYGLFDYDLERNAKYRRYTLNRFNYDAAHEFLLPRAVAYSAGLINHFFRGRISIANSRKDASFILTNNSKANAKLAAGGRVSLYHVDEKNVPTRLYDYTLESDLLPNESMVLPGMPYKYMSEQKGAKVGDRILVVYRGKIAEERGIATAHTTVEFTCNRDNQRYAHIVIPVDHFLAIDVEDPSTSLIAKGGRSYLEFLRAGGVVDMSNGLVEITTPENKHSRIFKKALEDKDGNPRAWGYLYEYYDTKYNVFSYSLMLGGGDTTPSDMESLGLPAFRNNDLVCITW